MSLCVLAQYRIGETLVELPEVETALADISEYAIGGQRWVIKYRTEGWKARSFSIPGRDPALSRNARGGSPTGKAGKAPDPEHTAWQLLVGLVEALCVSKEGEALMPGM